MDRELMKSAEQFHIRRRQRSVWKKLVSVLGCIVVFCTTYALILPAITMERETNCGFREHQHSESCYTQQVVKQMVCSGKDIGVHTHIAECGSDCGYAAFVIHEHAASCYDDSGALVCTLPQVKEHTHSSDCYRVPQIVVGQHDHTDACNSMQKAKLLCTLAESDGHTHSGDCWSQVVNLVCALEESENHAHSETCYSAETVLSCGKEEIQAHHHAEDCYRWENRLSCGVEEGPIYGPGEPELTCTKKEVKAHTHTKQCFDTDGNWICGQLQILRHTHGDSCFDMSKTETILTCGLEEHSHTEECFAEATETTEETTEATEETTEATEEVTEATEEEQTMPAQSFQGLTESNVVVLADADAGAFPAGTTMYASDVAVATARKLAEESADEDTEILDAVGVNITFRDADGLIIEPENGALVRVNIVLPEEKKLEGDDFSLVHRHNDGSLETVENAEVTSDGAGFTTESFSVYIVTALGDKSKNEVHATFTDDLLYYPNGPYNLPWDVNRPYILHVGDSVQIAFEYPNTEENKGLYVYYVNRTRGPFNPEDETGPWEYRTQGYYEDANHELSLTASNPSTSPNDSAKNRILATVTGTTTHNNEDYSLYVITFGPLEITNPESESIPNTQENIFIRVVNGVYVEDVNRGSDNFRNYYDHADLEIDNSGYFTGKHTTYYLDKTEVENVTYNAIVSAVKKCTIKDSNQAPVPVTYCALRKEQAVLYDVCGDGDSNYAEGTDGVQTLGYIDGTRYADNNSNVTQYEFTSKYGHVRFPTTAYTAEFVFNLLLTPQIRDLTILDLDGNITDSLLGQDASSLSSLTSENATASLTHQSMVDAYNYCPDHSGLDFHIGGNISAKIDFKFDPVTVYLGAKKQLNGKALNEGEFSFILIDNNVNNVNNGNNSNTEPEPVTNDADGIIRFAPLNFSQAGTYYYTIKEVVPTPQAPGIVYDEKEIKVKIVVTGSSQNSDMAATIYYGEDNGDNTVYSMYTGLSSLPVFTNRYETGNLTIQKKVVGKAADSDEIYTLTIRRMDGASINWSGLRAEKVKIDSNEIATIPIHGSEYETVLDISGNERITIFGLPIGEYSIQEWKTPVTPEYTWVEKNWGNQPKDPLWSNPLDPNHTNGWWYFAGVVELTATAPNATQLITNTFCQLAVTKRVEGNSAPADTTPYTVKVTSDGSVKWDKVQASSSNPDRTVSLTVDNGVSFTLVKDETVTLAELPAGTYTVEETTLNGAVSVAYSPNGGVITTNAEHYQDAVVITNTFPTGYELPATGGPGTGRYTLGGFTMAAGAVLWLCYRRKRRREGG